MNVDLDALESLSKTLHDLAGKAGAEKIGPAAGPFINANAGIAAQAPDAVLTSVQAAADVCHNLIEGDLVPAIQTRLKTTGDVMADLAKTYRGKDDSNADSLISAYKNSVGDWSAQEQV
ncbi:MAG: hypothetical protein J2P18_06575 [Nocardia sp.]|nr:hypothetical protein [Nocardia sp.]